MSIFLIRLIVGLLSGAVAHTLFLQLIFRVSSSILSMTANQDIPVISRTASSILLNWVLPS